MSPSQTNHLHEQNFVLLITNHFHWFFLDLLKLDKSKQESRTKDDALEKLEENFHTLESKVKNKDQLCRNQQEKINELESQFGMKADLCRQMDRQLTELSMKARVGEDIRENLQQKVTNFPSLLHLLLTGCQIQFYICVQCIRKS